MQVSAQAQAFPGVRAALVAMGTELNLGLLDGLGMRRPAGAGPYDLLVAIKTDDAVSLSEALAAVNDALAAGGRSGAESSVAAVVALTTRSAIAESGHGIALVSVPGPFALAEAMDALDAGCDVMVFSDNVPIWQEVALKDAAARRGLLVMGPDCGTAIVGGVGLGFANSVRPGPIGLVAASGTGAQQVSCLLDAAGGWAGAGGGAAAGAGCGAVLGIGGRDLSAEVGGRSARAALMALD